jgi:hypothetical protein
VGARMTTDQKYGLAGLIVLIAMAIHRAFHGGF